MGLIGEIFADAGLHLDKASFTEYGSMLKQAEGQISDLSTFSQTALTGAFTGIAAGVAGVAAYGTSIASAYEDAGLTLQTLYGSQEAAQQKFEWLADFAATTPFEFPELLESATRLKAYGMDIEQYGQTVGDTAAAMGKPIMAVVEALADAQQGEFERMKEFGIKAVEITKKNYEQLGASLEDAGQTALTYMDENGKQQIAVVDRNNKEMVTSTIAAIWNDKYAGAMEARSKSFSGMLSTIKDNMSAGLADMIGFDMQTMEVQSASLLGVLSGLALVALDVSGAFSNMSEPAQMFFSVAAVGALAISGLAAGFIAYGAILPFIAADTAIFGVVLSAAIWPATAVVAILALVAAGLVYLDEKTGIVSAAWQTLKDIFTISAYYIGQAVGWLRDWIVTKIEEIKTSLSNMIPDSWVSGVTTVWNTVTSVIGGAGNSIHQEVEKISQDHNKVGTSAGSAKDKVVDATGGMISGYSGAGLAAGDMAVKTDAATGQMSGGLFQVGADALIMAGKVGGAVSPVELLKAMTGQATTVNQSYAASFINVANQASDAASAAISSASRIGSAIKTSISQVGELEALAGKWNTRAKIGVTSGGGAGTGEGNVKIRDPTGQYAAPVTRSGGGGTGERNVKITNVKINNQYNTGQKVSSVKTKSAV